MATTTLRCRDIIQFKITSTEDLTGTEKLINQIIIIVSFSYLEDLITIEEYFERKQACIFAYRSLNNIDEGGDILSKYIINILLKQIKDKPLLNKEMINTLEEQDDLIPFIIDKVRRDLKLYDHSLEIDLRKYKPLIQS